MYNRKNKLSKFLITLHKIDKKQKGYKMNMYIQFKFHTLHNRYTSQMKGYKAIHVSPKNMK